MACPDGLLRATAVGCPTAAPDQLNGVDITVRNHQRAHHGELEVAVLQSDTGLGCRYADERVAVYYKHVLWWTGSWIPHGGRRTDPVPSLRCPQEISGRR